MIGRSNILEEHRKVGIGKLSTHLSQVIQALLIELEQAAGSGIIRPPERSVAVACMTAISKRVLEFMKQQGL